MLVSALVLLALTPVGMTASADVSIRATPTEVESAKPTVRAVSTSTPAAPSQRWGAQMAEDTAAGYALLFSGSNGEISQNGVEYGDTWTYESGQWKYITPPSCTNATCPVARAYGGMSYFDRADQQYVVLFGGRTSTALLGDTWIFNGSWHNVTPEPLDPYHDSPPATEYMAMVWDSASGFDLVYGGCTPVAGCNSPSSVSSQTWAFEGLNASGEAQWVNLTGQIHPPSLYSSSSAYDPAANQIVLFGGGTPGNSHPTYLNQTWTYSTTGGWVDRTALNITATNTPPFRGLVDEQMAYNPTTATVVLFGGQHFWASPTEGDKTSNATINDTWSYSNGTWENISGSLSVSPHPRFGAAMAFDPSDDALVLFGGLSGTMVDAPVLADTWWFSGSPGVWTNHTSPVATYPVEFTETGLPAGTQWDVTLTNSQSFTSRTTTLAFGEPKGNYAYTASASGYSSSSGNLTLSGPPGPSTQINFRPTPPGWGTLTIVDLLAVGVVVTGAALAATVVLLRRKRKALPSSPPERPNR